MGIDNLIRDEEVKRALDLVVARPKRQLGLVTRVPAASGSRWVPEGADYAVRFELHRLARGSRTPVATRPWVAEIAAGEIDFVREVMGERPREYLGIGDGEFPLCELKALSATASSAVAAAKTAVAQYVASAKPAKRERMDVARHACVLARLDLVGRGGLALLKVADINAIRTGPPHAEVEEVAEIGACVPVELGRTDRVFLNPQFGSFGADADLIVGSTLVDIKTVKNAALEVAYLRQLIAYLILARAARRDGQDLPEIDALGVYFAREAHLWTIPAGPIVGHPSFAAAERTLFAAGRMAHAAE